MSAPDYYFSANVYGSSFTGRSTGPKPGMCTNDLALLGESLIAYAKAPPLDRPIELARLEARLVTAQRHQ